MHHLFRYAMLATILIAQSLPAVEAAPDDQTLIAMANRRLEAGDLGLTSEQLLLRAATAYDGRITKPSGPASVLKRGVATAGGIPDVRFRVPLQNGAKADVLVLDARITRDSFGDLSMEWHYNIDQTLVEREHLEAARVTEQHDLDRRFPDRMTEARAAEALKSAVFPAQVQFQAGGYEDRDKNGIGDYAQDLAALSGDRKVIPPGGGAAVTLDLLPRRFSANLEQEGFAATMLADAERGFWCFIVLPSRARTLAIDATGVVRVFPGVVQPADVAEAKRVMPTGTVHKRAP